MSRARKSNAHATVNPVDTRLRKIVWIAALLNLAYFGIEFAVALRIHSVSLFADSVDFLEDASLNLLIAAAFGWRPLARARLGMLLAALLLAPGIATLWTALEKIHAPSIPAPQPLSLAAAGAMAVNLTCALLLAKYRNKGGSITRAAFLSARNDVLANVAILLAACVTLYVRSFWPDLIVGMGIAALNLDAAREVWTAAHKEHASASTPAAR